MSDLKKRVKDLEWSLMLKVERMKELECDISKLTQERNSIETENRRLKKLWRLLGIEIKIKDSAIPWDADGMAI